MLLKSFIKDGVVNNLITRRESNENNASEMINETSDNDSDYYKTFEDINTEESWVELNNGVEEAKKSKIK